MTKNDKKRPNLLIILDGFGYSRQKEGNAVAAANMPNFKNWLQKYPNCLLKASGEAVGLPKKYMGNSEVGHTCIGSGRIVKTILKKFNESIKNGDFFKNKLLIKNFEKLKKKNNHALHLMGLLSDAGIHSHEKHLYALIKLAKKIGLKKVYIHTFLDGRDTAPKSARQYLQKLQDFCNKLNLGKIASLHGRFYAMDRDKNWNRTKQSYDILCSNQNKNLKNLTWQAALENSYKQKNTDEFLKPIRLISDGIIEKGDGIIFFNFRPDRARQLTRCFIDPNFNEFKVKNLNSTKGTLSFFITTTRYKNEFSKFDNDIIFEKEKIENTLLDEISKQTNKKVYIIAETEKYAHVTYFFRGRKEKKLPNEKYTLIPSIKTKNYIDNPEMSAQKITNHILDSLKKDPAYFYLVNYANPDMVGHSGNFAATKKACEFLDIQLEKLYKEVIEKQNGTIFITADHGNAEEMKNKYKTSHTTNPVIFMLINKYYENKKTSKKYKKPKFGLANIAPTILKYLNLKIPAKMDQKIITLE
ncbi:2,3-bisphosphoglycerate-independent phosphoglycerate mutase [Candidatus Dependentiae bacterium]|nr:2,3-bisphosphoglycerate-independent phosphoglycerate mutase [Candidatus Dependentiae bacterium]